MVEITPFSKQRLESSLAFYCPKFAKQFGEKWFPHAYKVVGRVAGTLLKSKLIYRFLTVVSPDVGTAN